MFVFDELFLNKIAFDLESTFCGIAVTSRLFARSRDAAKPCFLRDSSDTSQSAAKIS